MSSAGCTCVWDLEASEPVISWKKSSEAVEEEDVALDEAIDAAGDLVSDHYDDEEPTIQRQAFDRAETFLRTQSREMKKRLNYFPPPPSITPGPNGSADLHWQHANWGLLVNVPAAAGAPATFYGEGSEGATNRIKGSLDPMTWSLGLITWLSKA